MRQGYMNEYYTAPFQVSLAATAFSLSIIAVIDIVTIGDNRGQTTINPSSVASKNVGCPLLSFCFHPLFSSAKRIVAIVN